MREVYGASPRSMLCTLSLCALTPPFWGLVRVFWLSSDPACRGGSLGPGVRCCLSLDFALAPSGRCRLRRPHAESSAARGPAREAALFNLALSQASILCVSCVCTVGERDPFQGPAPSGFL